MSKRTKSQKPHFLLNVAYAMYIQKLFDLWCPRHLPNLVCAAETICLPRDLMTLGSPMVSVGRTMAKYCHTTLCLGPNKNNTTTTYYNNNNLKSRNNRASHCSGVQGVSRTSVIRALIILILAKTLGLRTVGPCRCGPSHMWFRNPWHSATHNTLPCHIHGMYKCGLYVFSSFHTAQTNVNDHEQLG